MWGQELCFYHLNLAQETPDNKENEITVVLKVSDNLVIKGSIDYRDAIGTQTGTAEQIISAEAEYVLCLKENHKHLFLNTRDAFTGKDTRFVYSIFDKAHERVEERASTLRIEDVFEPDECKMWLNLRALVQFLSVSPPFPVVLKAALNMNYLKELLRT